MWYSTFDCVKWGGELLHLRWIFPLVLESTYEGDVGSAIRVDSGPHDLVLLYRFLLKDLCIFSGWCGGYPPWDTPMIYGTSALCFDLPSVGIFWKDSEDPGGACLPPSYTSDKEFSKSRLLAIIGLPWPMAGAWHMRQGSGLLPSSLKVHSPQIQANGCMAILTQVV